MKLYISGPITGTANYEENFVKAESVLKQVEYEVVNPCDILLNGDATWEDYMKADIPLMLACDGVAVLPGWEASAGARLEVDIAQRLNMPIKDVYGWIKNETNNKS